MTSRLLIAAFLLAITGNALAGVSPHLDGGGGCAPSCCEAARDDGPGSYIAQVCCLTDCSQPGGTHSPTPTASIASQRQKSFSAVLFSLDPDPLASFIRYKRFPKSPTKKVAGSTDRYLETGSLLI